jgi:hypothetical protein
LVFKLAPQQPGRGIWRGPSRIEQQLQTLSRPALPLKQPHRLKGIGVAGGHGITAFMVRATTGQMS